MAKPLIGFDNNQLTPNSEFGRLAFRDTVTLDEVYSQSVSQVSGLELPPTFGEFLTQLAVVNGLIPAAGFQLRADFGRDIYI